VLTYDDGPGPVLTPQLLDLLAAHDARATFFPLGRRAEAAPEVLDRVQRTGHEIGCHGYAHRNAWKSSPRAAVEDVEAGYAALAPWVVADGVFRPPYGKLVGPTWLALRRRGAPLGWWTVDSGDTTHADLPDPDAVARSVAEAGGGVVLLHDHDREPEWAGREAYVLEVTRALLRAAAQNGLRTCALSAVI
jgi:peptidoglycan/xylan/chitin deacetylase (PgdA/CDA1 family)